MNKLIVIAFCLISSVCKAQTEPPKLYNPDANAKKEIKAAVKKARKENKYQGINFKEQNNTKSNK